VTTGVAVDVGPITGMGVLLLIKDTPAGEKHCWNW